ncbi:toxin-antitoxin system YwqK family antitoxin [Patiriisocius sp. Uisw_047]|jgi:antitoxin component YwqK of YwqJK toxin-antitoxin module|uniref:toxin-antitoxin system YwqK family antitoxin n=1 Tax=Patiriisocius sp. Uisw_047 TaxID=3230969 RepID=UPI0039E95445
MRKLIFLILSIALSTGISAQTFTPKCEETVKGAITYYKSQRQGVTDKGSIRIKYTQGSLDLISEFNFIGLKVGTAKLATTEDGEAPALINQMYDNEGDLNGLHCVNFPDWKSFVFIVEPVVQESCKGEYQMGKLTDGPVSNWEIYVNNKEFDLDLEEFTFSTMYVSNLEDKGNEIGKLENGERTGEWKYYYENGQLESILKYENGFLKGEMKYYYENGQLSLIGKWENGQPIGEWKSYHENGQLYNIGKNENGKKTGEWKFYHENGQLHNIGKYENGKKTGEWKFYHKNGQLHNIGKYENGERTGEWKYYDENGNFI